MFELLEKINERPAPFEFYTASELWTDEHTSRQMLAYHLNGDVDLSSRNSSFIKESVRWIVSRFKVGENTKIADFGCGPGLYALELARKKAGVTGIDFSNSSIQYARNSTSKRGLSITYVQQNYLNFETDERFDLIIMIMCDFCALSPDQRKGLLRKFYSMLAPGGSVLLDVYSLKAFEIAEEQSIYQEDLLSGFWSAAKYYGFQNTFKYENDRVILDKYTIVEKTGFKEVYNWLQHFSTDDLDREFRDAGFSIEERYSDVAGGKFDPDSIEFAIIASQDPA